MKEITLKLPIIWTPLGEITGYGNEQLEELNQCHIC